MEGTFTGRGHIQGGDIQIQMEYLFKEDIHGRNIHGRNIHGRNIHGGDIHGGDIHRRGYTHG